MKALTNVEPIATMCAVGPCPGVYHADEGMVVIGRRLSAVESAPLADNIGEGEVAVLLPHDLVEMTPRNS